MDLERALVVRVLRSETAFKIAMEQRVTSKFFPTAQHQKAWAWITKYWQEYGEAPTENAFTSNYPTYKLPEVEEPTTYIIDELKEQRRSALLISALGRAADLLDAEVGVSRDAISLIQQAFSEIEIEVTSTRDDDLATTVDERVESYRQMAKNRGKLLGIPTGYHGIDKLSAGLQPEQLITLVGLSKGGKSMVLLNMASEAHSCGYSPLLISFEMSNREQSTRFDGMAAELNYRKILQGGLSPTEWTALTSAMNAAAHGRFILTSDSSGGMNLNAIQAKIIQHRPDIVFIDGVYMMDDQDGAEKGTPRALTNVTRGLKRLAQNYRVPIVGTTQALSWKTTSKKGVQADSIGYTSSFVQDSDLVIAVDHDEDRQDVAQLKVLLNRMGPRGEFSIHWDFDTMNFTQLDDPGGGTSHDDGPGSF